MKQIHWICCPNCGSKTRDRLRADPILINSPIHCPKCKQETLINARDLQITVIKRQQTQQSGVNILFGGNRKWQNHDLRKRAANTKGKAITYYRA